MAGPANRELDLVVYGASGYTGRLVAEYLARLPEADAGLHWAIAGRDGERLAQVRQEIGAPLTLPILVADAADPHALAALAARSRLVLSTVGPYQTHGSLLLAACAAAGTAYVDLCGEPVWMRAMIDTYSDAARESGACIVFSCGFDSIPFDLGVWHLQEQARLRFGTPCQRVDARVRKLKGPFSGGTVASLKATLVDCRRRKEAARLMRDPFALTPGFAGPEQPPDTEPRFDPDLGAWLAPFLMAPINSKNIHRSNLLAGHPYGRDFRYSEMLVAGAGKRGEDIARALAADEPLLRPDAPRPGEGPSREERESGYFEILFIGRTRDGQHIRTRVSGAQDPGYGSTSMMVAQSALCLLQDQRERRGGIWTPATALGSALIGRLAKYAQMVFSAETE
jgi:short subunit dehydrogenase-like uncharacterized protein